MPFPAGPLARCRDSAVAAFALCAALLITAALSGCGAPSAQRRADRFDGRRNVVHGLVVPGDAYARLSATGRTSDFDAWLAARNNDQVNPRPAAYPWSYQFVELWQREDLKIINGRPRGYTSSETRTYRMQHQR